MERLSEAEKGQRAIITVHALHPSSADESTFSMRRRQYDGSVCSL